MEILRVSSLLAEASRPPELRHKDLDVTMFIAAALDHHRGLAFAATACAPLCTIRRLLGVRHMSLSLVVVLAPPPHGTFNTALLSRLAAHLQKCLLRINCLAIRFLLLSVMMNFPG
jgi:hypothetical protein